MTSFLKAMFKLLLASLIAGALMNLFGMSADRLLAAIGLTPAALWDQFLQFIAWAIPNIALGAVVILPLWLCAYIFLPPRSGGAE